jgi:enoyl-CoA hydratase/carnithine racemase
MTENPADRYTYQSPDYKDYATIIYDPGIVTRIVLNRPRYLNAIGHPTLGELGHAFDRAAQDPECKVIVVSGAGRCFSAGDDTIGHTPLSAPMMADGRTPEQLVADYGSESAAWRAYNLEHEYLTHTMWEESIRLLPKPTIAMVHGYAMYMAFHLADTMDLIFASQDALFLIGSVSWALGPRRSLEYLYEHRFMTVEEALAIGFVNRAYPTFEVLEEETLAFAYRVAENPMYGNWGTVTHKSRAEELRNRSGYTQWESERRSYEERQYKQTGVPEADKNRHRYEGRGMARAPRALANLKTKLEFEGKPVPPFVLEALKNAAARDDREFWQKALSQEWRDDRSKQRATTHAELFEEAAEAADARLRAEISKRSESGS